MSLTTTRTGRPQRKQLADQIDRLDVLLDGLADGLDAAIADAAREGARQAVREAILEVLANPELQALLRPAAPEPTPPKPGPGARLRARLAAVRAALARTLRPVAAAVTDRARAVRGGLTAVAWAAHALRPLRRVLLVGLAAGLATAAVCYLTPHLVAVLVGGAGATATAVAVQAGLRVRDHLRRFGLA